MALLETKQELLAQQTELDDLRCAVAEMEENERELLSEVSSTSILYSPSPSQSSSPPILPLMIPSTN